MRHPWPVDSPQFQVRERLLTDNYSQARKLPALFLDNLVDRVTSDFQVLGLDSDTEAELDDRVAELEEQVEKLAQDLNTAEETIADMRTGTNGQLVIALRF